MRFGDETVLERRGITGRYCRCFRCGYKEFWRVSFAQWPTTCESPADLPSPGTISERKIIRPARRWLHDTLFNIAFTSPHDPGAAAITSARALTNARSGYCSFRGIFIMNSCD
ncbi:hypothetical protein KCP78_06245 [Salmonella enterica subsp. enterica]|nr:hypothetical protein KCP78_06245 [Salmonella enterica subsp. enterica]